MKLVFLMGLLFAAQFEHGQHPSILPTDEQTWRNCCHEMDCIEAPLTVQRMSAEQYAVSVADFPVFQANAEKVRPSQNGKSYFCTQNAQIPPTERNILCVFFVRPELVRRDAP